MLSKVVGMTKEPDKKENKLEEDGRGKGESTPPVVEKKIGGSGGQEEKGQRLKGN